MKISFQPADATALTPFTSESNPFPTSSGALRISVGQTPAPLASLSISDSGIATATVQIPWELSSQAISSVTIWVNNSASTFTGLAVQPAGPALQTADGKHPSLWSPDGTLISGAVAGGSILQLRLTGTGPFQPATATNTAGSSGQAPVLPVLAFLDGYGLPVDNGNCRYDYTGCRRDCNRSPDVAHNRRTPTVCWSDFFRFSATKRRDRTGHPVIQPFAPSGTGVSCRHRQKLVGSGE